MYFAVLREHGPSWDRTRGLREQRLWDEHAAFMDDLAEAGFVVLAGPLGADAALLVVDAADETEVRDRLAADPWRDDMLRTSLLERWDVLLGTLRPA